MTQLIHEPISSDDWQQADLFIARLEVDYRGTDHTRRESWTVITAFKLQARTSANPAINDALMTTDAAEVWGWF